MSKEVKSSNSMTEKLDLRTGKPIWSGRSSKRLGVQEPARSVACDVAIIGAGISGALIGEMLTEAGLKVIFLDRRGPVKGSTAASTAMLQYELDTPLSHMADRIGRDRAERLWRRSRLAVDALRERTERLGINADTDTRNSIYLDGNVLDAAGLAEEADARRRAGFEIELLGPSEVRERFGIVGRHAIVGYGNYMADPCKLAMGYLDVALSRGAKIYAPAEVIGLEPGSDSVSISIKNGPTVKAGQVVLATGYERLKGIPTMGNKVISSWSIATRPQKSAIWPGGALIWEASDPYLYIRATPRGEIICGGEDEEITDEQERDEKIPQKIQALARKLGALLPGIDPTPAYAWAGSFGTSPVGTPTIGRIPRMPGCYTAMGYGGNGITFSMMAAQMLRSQILGGSDPDSDLVSFYRSL